MSLARSLAVSPYRLSRAFTAELGVSLTRYRNRIRVGRAMERLAEGAPNLAGLAAELGFADQAHLSRTLRQHVGNTPTAVRRLVTASRPHAAATATATRSSAGQGRVLTRSGAGGAGQASPTPPGLPSARAVQRLINSETVTKR